jgi:hypothetical protein
MKSDCEILVEARALATALTTRGAESSWRQAHTVTFGPARTGLRVTSAGIDAEIRGVGRWTRQIEVEAELIAGIAAKLGDAPIVTVIYAANRLMVNRFAIDAADRGMLAPAFASPKSGQQWEMDLGPAETATPSPRKLRPRRPQRHQGLPLFTKPH